MTDLQRAIEKAEYSEGNWDLFCENVTNSELAALVQAAQRVNAMQGALEVAEKALEKFILTHYYDRGNCEDIIQGREALSTIRKAKAGEEKLSKPNPL